ncbi:ABC transporter permease [Rhizobacter sp. Root1221]|uniref:ABC transporter permease n=1 Tax=Rhizobacter sp. Root1221 TaxID=1736433 RepID=UPI0006F2740F|nr:ABC transporter permease subunit [Rhizobacter sp. Root1221]KQW00270.1 ABC transporter permease [Rhizobacter sp. Root1221]
MRAVLDRLGWRGWVLPVTLLVLAEVAMRIKPVESDALARPTDVLNALAQAIADGSALRLSAQTLAAALAGLALGGGVGLAAGIWFGLSRAASDAAALSVELLRPVPSVALIPLSMLVFGFGFRMEIAVIAFTCFWPMLLLSHAAVRNVEPRLLEVARVLGFSWWERILKLVLPAALPRIFVAFRLCVGIALVVAVTTEIAANPQGLGYALMNAQQSLRPDLMFAMLLWIGLLGWGLGAGLLLLQRTLFQHSLAQQP